MAWKPSIGQVFMAVICCALLGSCGGDEQSQPLLLTSGLQLDVAGKYEVNMAPLGSSCFDLYPTGSLDRFYVVQYGNQIYIDIEQQSGYFDPYSAVFVSGSTFEGELDSYGSFYAYAPSTFDDGYGSGYADWSISGTFDYAYLSIQGVSDITLYGPYEPCTVSHTFSGYQ